MINPQYNGEMRVKPTPPPADKKPKKLSEAQLFSKQPTKKLYGK
jgi:hypothetical protein